MYAAAYTFAAILQHFESDVVTIAGQPR